MESVKPQPPLLVKLKVRDMPPFGNNVTAAETIYMNPAVVACVSRLEMQDDWAYVELLIGRTLRIRQKDCDSFYVNCSPSQLAQKLLGAEP